MDQTGLAVAHAGIITNAPRIGDILLSVLNGLLQIVGALGIVAFVAVGILYIFSRGEENWLRSIKKWIVQTLIGLVIIFGALVLLRFIANSFIG